jgi:hypothetical protein
MKKEFIPYEQALELRQLGYNDECTMYYAPGHPEGYYLVDATPLSNSHWMFTADDNKRRETMCAAPLYQQAFRWFREKYGLYAEIFVDDNKTFGFYITSFIEEGRLDKPITRQFNTYDEAELGCVKQLIEIIDRKDEAYQ